MLERLIMPDEKTNPDPRGDLDRILEVDYWSTPVTTPTRAADVPPEAPVWWRGEEEASQSFFTAMGIDPTKLGG
jgi:hypothetical protein